MTKKIKYLTLSIMTGKIKDSNFKEYSYKEAQELIDIRGNSLGLSLSLIRLQRMKWNFATLRESYKAELRIREAYSIKL